MRLQDEQFAGVPVSENEAVDTNQVGSLTYNCVFTGLNIKITECIFKQLLSGPTLTPFKDIFVPTMLVINLFIRICFCKGKCHMYAVVRP